MAMILIKRDQRAGEEFDPDQIKDQLKKTFPAICFDPGDQLQLKVERAREDESTPTHIVESLEQDARLYGPAYAFSLKVGADVVWGTVRKVDVTFLSQRLPEASDWEALVSFAHDLGIGAVTVDTDELIDPT